MPGATEGILWKMLGFTLDGRPFVAIASHKSYLSLYLMDIYYDASLRQKHDKALSKLKMGKSCINFQSVDELPLDTIAAILAEAPTISLNAATMGRMKAQTEAVRASKTAKRVPAGKRAPARSHSK